ncbi:MAG TPA: Nif3-like dinuclear metal center hexameric protein [Tepidisphaeraceae bacterium]|jgi:dinuclear metal center YbgI/SA1388 family protein
MKLSQVLDALQAIAPNEYAESWDNVGLLVGDPSHDVSAAMLTIDYTPEVACEASGAKCDLIIAYHPPIFDALKRITSTSLIFDAIRRGAAIYSPHTALDVAPGGTNDMLADAIGMTDRAPLRSSDAKATHFKLVTFVPQESLEKVSRALFDAGAGNIGNYSSCSFQLTGTGTFFGGQGANPAVGKSGKLERANEIRFETVVPISVVDRVIHALRTSHPYEEPAFDLNVLAPAPSGLGLGRVGTVPSTPREELFDHIKKELSLTHLLISGPMSGNVTRAAVCAGACGDLLDDAIAQKVDLYLTGEMRHHDAIKAARAGVTVVCTLHSNSERAVLKRLAAELSKRAPGLRAVLSQQDRDPFAVR